MPRLTIRHKTEYAYAKPVSFGEHRVMLRPRDGHDLRVLENNLQIGPVPSQLRWIHDVFGNSVGIARLEGAADRLTFESTLTIDHHPVEGVHLTSDDTSWRYPFAYDEDELPDLSLLIAPQFEDSNGVIRAWAQQFVSGSGDTLTERMLTDMTHAIRERFSYTHRFTPGVQTPAETLRSESGTCRDFALFMIEAVRSLGLAARFVSGYIYVRGDVRDGHRGGGNTHAWLQVYLPNAGWVEFDPTNGIVGNRDLIRVAVAREPRQAIPLSGTYMGAASDHVAMTVDIEVAEAAA
jgi:transglutaminase-like putative cysteine protease